MISSVIFKKSGEIFIDRSLQQVDAIMKWPCCQCQFNSLRPSDAYMCQ